MADSAAGQLLGHAATALLEQAKARAYVSLDLDRAVVKIQVHLAALTLLSTRATLLEYQQAAVDKNLSLSDDTQRNLQDLGDNIIATIEGCIKEGLISLEGVRDIASTRIPPRATTMKLLPKTITGTGSTSSATGVLTSYTHQETDKPDATDSVRRTSSVLSRAGRIAKTSWSRMKQEAKKELVAWSGDVEHFSKLVDERLAKNLQIADQARAYIREVRELHPGIVRESAPTKSK